MAVSESLACAAVTSGAAGWLRRTALLLAFTLPLWLVVGRAATDIAVSVIALCFLFTLILQRDASIFRQWEVKWLLIFWLLLVLSSSLHSQGSMDGDAIIKTLSYVRFLLLYAALRFWLYNSRQMLIRAAQWAMPVLALVVVDGWWQYLDGLLSLTGRYVTGKEGDRLTGPLSHPNLGNYLFKCLLPVLLIAWAMRLNSLRKGVVYAFGVLGFLLIPLSGERSITLMLLVGMAVFFALALLGVQRYRRGLSLAAAVFLVGLGALATQPVVRARADLFVEQVSRFPQTVYGQLFEAAIRIWQQSPLIGVGYGGFEARCAALMEQGGITYCDIHPHNTYLHILMSTGLYGLAAMLAFFYCAVRPVLRDYQHHHSEGRLLASAQLALLAGLLFPAVVNQGFYSNWPAGIFWYSLACMVSLRHVLPSPKDGV